MSPRSRWAFLVLILAQTAHSTEEYVFRLFDVFAPARFVSSLVSDDLVVGFALVNAGLVLVASGAMRRACGRVTPPVLYSRGCGLCSKAATGLGTPRWRCHKVGTSQGSQRLLCCSRCQRIWPSHSGSALVMASGRCGVEDVQRGSRE